MYLPPKNFSWSVRINQINKQVQHHLFENVVKPKFYSQILKNMVPIDIMIIISDIKER